MSLSRRQHSVLAPMSCHVGADAHLLDATSQPARCSDRQGTGRKPAFRFAWGDECSVRFAAATGRAMARPFMIHADYTPSTFSLLAPRLLWARSISRSQRRGFTRRFGVQPVAVTAPIERMRVVLAAAITSRTAACRRTRVARPSTRRVGHLADDGLSILRWQHALASDPSGNLRARGEAQLG
jgi:hypothetical protein